MIQGLSSHMWLVAVISALLVVEFPTVLIWLMQLCGVI